MTVRMGYVPRRGAPRLPQGTSAPEGDHTPPEMGAGTAFGENGKESVLKAEAIFNPCEN